MNKEELDLISQNYLTWFKQVLATIMHQNSTDNIIWRYIKAHCLLGVLLYPIDDYNRVSALNEQELLTPDAFWDLLSDEAKKFRDAMSSSKLDDCLKQRNIKRDLNKPRSLLSSDPTLGVEKQ